MNWKIDLKLNRIQHTERGKKIVNLKKRLRDMNKKQEKRTQILLELQKENEAKAIICKENYGDLSRLMQNINPHIWEAL